MAVVKPPPARGGRMGAKHARGSGFLIVFPSISGTVIDDSLQHFVMHVSKYSPWKKGMLIEYISNVHLHRNSSITHWFLTPGDTDVLFDIHINPKGWGCYSDNCTLL
jgi:predicted phosphatase